VQHYEKYGEYRFRPAVAGEIVVTEIDGEEETRQVAKDGQFVITGPAGEEYAIDGIKFGSRYQVTGDGVAVPTPGQSDCYAFEHVGQGFTFIAPWGEPMIVREGDMIATTGDDRDVYRIKRTVFDATYRLAETVTTALKDSEPTQ
jgi:hypothetical protein